jgi:hypothetical protein
MHWAVLWLLNLILCAVVFGVVISVAVGPNSYDASGEALGRPFGLFGWLIGPFWLLVQCNFIRKVSGARGPLVLGCISAVGLVAGIILTAISTRLPHFTEGVSERDLMPIAVITLLASVAVYYVGCFVLWREMKAQYVTALFSETLTLFGLCRAAFGVIALQHYFRLIARGDIKRDEQGKWGFLGLQ